MRSLFLVNLQIVVWTLFQKKSAVDELKPDRLENWYRVSFDDQSIFRDVSPPGRKPWKDELRWDDIIRVCFLTQDVFLSDEIYIFTNKREESYLIPIDAAGTVELMEEMVRRRLFDAQMLIAAVKTIDKLFCWPPAEEAAVEPR